VQPSYASTPLVLDVKASVPFVLTLPLDMFVSSLSITILSVTLAEGYPLPSSINFAQPNTLRGVVGNVQLMPLRIEAVDLYSEVYAIILLNSTDTVPTVVSSWDPVRILAGQSFSSLRYQDGKIVDVDVGDTVTCSPLLSSLSPVPWVSVATVSPRTLQVSGTAPTGASHAFPHDQNVTVILTCCDGVLCVNTSLVLWMQEAVPPKQTLPLPNISVAAEDTLQTVLDVGSFFEDSTGGTVSLGAVTMDSTGLATWLQLQRVSDTVVQLTGVPSVDQAGSTEGTTFALRIDALNAFGNATSGIVHITVTATTWQLILQYSALIYSLIGIILSILSLWIYWVPLVNTVTLPWRRVACPLTTSPSGSECVGGGACVEEDEDGVLSYSVHKTCHELVGYVKMSDKVAGRLRRLLRCMGALASYWDLQISYDRRLPRWLYLRGDHRAVFSAQDGDDGIDAQVVIHEVNVYGVILREYHCCYDEVLSFLLLTLPALQRVGGAADDGGHTKPWPMMRDAVVVPDSALMSLEDIMHDNDANTQLRDEQGGTRGLGDVDLLFDEVEGIESATLPPSTATNGLPLSTSPPNREDRRQQLRVEAMRRQLLQQMDSSHRSLTSHVDQQLEGWMRRISEKIDGLSNPAACKNDAEGTTMTRSTTNNNKNNRSNDSGFSSPTAANEVPFVLPLPHSERRGRGGGLLLDSADRVSDPLAELNRAIRGTSTTR
jgi:hypothetical protein